LEDGFPVDFASTLLGSSIAARTEKKIRLPSNGRRRTGGFPLSSRLKAASSFLEDEDEDDGVKEGRDIASMVMMMMMMSRY
tara:strand:+ start:398 stop:640 length:243 start_codon:yes stop_codon:yes gene_type:complete